MGRKKEKADQRKVYKESFKSNKYGTSSQPVKNNKVASTLGKKHVEVRSK